MSKILRVPVDKKVDLRGLGGSTVYSGQFQLGTTSTNEDGMAVYESVDGTNFYRLVVLDASGMQSTLPDTPYIYVVEKDAKTYGSSGTELAGTVVLHNTAGVIKGFTSTTNISAGDKIQVTGTLTGGIATLDASGIAADEDRTAGTYDEVSATGALSGTSATVDVVVDANGAVTSIVVGDVAGSGYVPGESITIADSALGGGGAAAITFTVATTNAGTGIVSGTTYEVKAITGSGNTAEVELTELDGTALTNTGTNLVGLSFALLDSTALGATATLSQLQGSSKYFGASTLHYYKEG